MCHPSLRTRTSLPGRRASFPGPPSLGSFEPPSLWGSPVGFALRPPLNPPNPNTPNRNANPQTGACIRLPAAPPASLPPASPPPASLSPLKNSLEKRPPTPPAPPRHLLLSRSRRGSDLKVQHTPRGWRCVDCRPPVGPLPSTKPACPSYGSPSPPTGCPPPGRPPRPRAQSRRRSRRGRRRRRPRCSP